MNVAKYTRNQAGNILAHANRGDPNRTYSNQEINHDKTYLNYNLAPEHGMTDYQYMKKRCEDLHCMKRKDVNTLASWCVTLPKDYTGDVEQFFQESYNFLSERYGIANVVSAYVHMDETTPHMHFCFVPAIMKENKYGEMIEKVNAKTCISRTELNRIHPEIQEYLSNKLGQEVHMLNGATEGGNKTINQLKNETLIKKINENEGIITNQNREMTTNNLVIQDQKKNINFQKKELEELKEMTDEANENYEEVCKNWDNADKELKTTKEEISEMNSEWANSKVALDTINKEKQDKLDEVDKEIEEYRRTETTKANKEIKDKKQEILDKLPNNVLNFLYFTRNVVLHMFSKIEGNKEIEDKLDEAVHEADPGNQLEVYDNYNPITQQQEKPDTEETDEEI